MAFVTFGDDSAHFRVKAKCLFVLRVTAEIESFISVFAAKIANYSESRFTDAFSVEIFEKIEGLNIEQRPLFLQDEVADFLIFLGDEKDGVFIGSYAKKVFFVVHGIIEIIDYFVRINSAVGRFPYSSAKFRKLLCFFGFCINE